MKHPFTLALGSILAFSFASAEQVLTTGDLDAISAGGVASNAMADAVGAMVNTMTYTDSHAHTGSGRFGRQVFYHKKEGPWMSTVWYTLSGGAVSHANSDNQAVAASVSNLWVGMNNNRNVNAPGNITSSFSETNSTAAHPYSRTYTNLRASAYTFDIGASVQSGGEAGARANLANETSFFPEF